MGACITARLGASSFFSGSGPKSNIPIHNSDQQCPVGVQVCSGIYTSILPLTKRPTNQSCDKFYVKLHEALSRCQRCAAAGYTVMATMLPNQDPSFGRALPCPRLIPDHRPRHCLRLTRPAPTAKAAPRPQSIPPRPETTMRFRAMHCRQMLACPCCRREATRQTRGEPKPGAVRCVAVEAAASSRTSSTHPVPNAKRARPRPLPRPRSRHVPVVKTKSSSGIREGRLARHG